MSEERVVLKSAGDAVAFIRGVLAGAESRPLEIGEYIGACAPFAFGLDDGVINTEEGGMFTRCVVDGDTVYWGKQIKPLLDKKFELRKFLSH